jgi:hypothetical protein
MKLMSEHKSGKSTFDKKLYKERRSKGLRGQIGYAIVVQRELDDKGNEVIVPVSGKRPPISNVRNRKDTGKAVDRRFTKPNHGGFVQQRQRASGNSRES